jgi:hypothetical protein
MNPPVPPERVLFARRTASRAMQRTVAGRPGGRRLLVSYLLAASLRCQASSVAGVTGKTPAQRGHGMNHVSAANQARSLGSYRTRPVCRRSTAFLVPEHQQLGVLRLVPPNIRTAKPKVQLMSMQVILSSTRPASHHRIIRAGETPGQRCDRVSERHKILRDYATHHNQHRPHRSLHGAAPLKPLPEPVDLGQYRIRKQARAGGLINEYRLVA